MLTKEDKIEILTAAIEAHYTEGDPNDVDDETLHNILDGMNEPTTDETLQEARRFIRHMRKDILYLASEPSEHLTEHARCQARKHMQFQKG